MKLTTRTIVLNSSRISAVQSQRVKCHHKNLQTNNRRIVQLAQKKPTRKISQNQCSKQQ